MDRLINLLKIFIMNKYLLFLFIFLHLFMGWRVLNYHGEIHTLIKGAYLGKDWKLLFRLLLNYIHNMVLWPLYFI